MQRADRSTSARHRAADLFRKPGLLVWCLFILLSPLYVFESGLPQPGDLLVLLLVPLSLIGWNGKLDRRNSQMLRALLWFIVWVFAVNYAWALILGKMSAKDFVVHPFFYAFNASVLFSALLLAKQDRQTFLRLTVDVVVLTIIVQVVSSFFFGTELYRGELFFNSPNQLGYYALLSACLIAMAQKPLGLSRGGASLVVTGCAYLALLTASRAALSGIAVLLFVLLFSNPRTIIMASIAAVVLLSVGGPISDAIDRSHTRATENRNPHMSFAEERGYDRIVNHPEYLLLGAGEGDYARFVKPGDAARELHSSFGSVLFSYGIVGILLFSVFAMRVVRGAPLRLMLLLVPALVFTVAHQGLRFTMFWVVLAAFIVLKDMSPPIRLKHGIAAAARS